MTCATPSCPRYREGVKTDVRCKDCQAICVGCQGQKWIHMTHWRNHTFRYELRSMPEETRRALEESAKKAREESDKNSRESEAFVKKVKEEGFPALAELIEDYMLESGYGVHDGHVDALAEAIKNRGAS